MEWQTCMDCLTKRKGHCPGEKHPRCYRMRAEAEARLAAETERAQLNGKAFLAAKDRIAALEAENRELRLKLNAPSALRIAARTRGGKTR